MAGRNFTLAGRRNGPQDCRRWRRRKLARQAMIAGTTKLAGTQNATCIML